jgi:hypothetical protein
MKDRMMKIDFRVDWGYQMLYSRRHYHPVYRWDGHLECSGFSELNVSLLEYPPAWWGPCHTAHETPLEKAAKLPASGSGQNAPRMRNSSLSRFPGPLILQQRIFLRKAIFLSP